MTGLVTVYATFADGEEAARVARILVEEGLAACANILAPCRSLYRWQGRIEDGEEVPALFKTQAERAGQLMQRLTELHSYDLPAAIVWPIADALDDYAAWVNAETR